MSEYQTILTDVSDQVATIRLNRPERRNAFSAEMSRELHEAFARFEADAGVRAIVVTGAGKYFSAGADLGRGGSTFARWDVRFAAADAKYGFVFTRRGIVPEAGSTWMLPRLVGVSRAMELLLSGRI